MNPLVKKVRLLLLIYVLSSYLTSEPLRAQFSLHDSLRHVLAYFEEHTNDEKIKQAVKETRAMYIKDTINDSLAKKLSDIDSLLITGSDTNTQMILRYAEMLVESFQNLAPVMEHPSYAASLDMLATLYYNLGKYDEMIPLFQQELITEKKIYGEEHRQYIITLNNLAYVYMVKGQNEKSLPLYLQALELRRKTVGAEHPEYAVTLSRLGDLYKKMGLPDKALPLQLQALSIIKEKLGENHLLYAYTLSSLALLYRSLGQYEKALPLFQLATTTAKKTAGEDHPDYARSLINLASLYEMLGQYEKALPLYQQALEIIRKANGEEHPDYALAIGFLANLYESMSEYQKALPLYQQALEIDKKAFGEEHAEYALTLNNLGYLYERMDQPEKALTLYQRALELRKKILGAEHPEYAISLNNLAAVYHKMGQNNKALPLFQESASITKKVLGEENPVYATNLNSLGMTYLDLNDQKEAAPLLMQAAKIKLKHLSGTYTSLSEQEKMFFLDKESAPFHCLPSLVFTQEHTDSLVLQQLYQNELILKGMVLEDQRKVLNTIRKSDDSTTLQLYEQWRVNMAIISKQLLLPLVDRLSYLDSLQEATIQLEQQLSQRAASFGNLQQIWSINVNDISRKLSKGEAAIEFIRFRLYHRKWTDSIIYAALILLPGSNTPRFVPLFEEKQLQILLNTSMKTANLHPSLSTVQKLYGKANKTISASLHNSLYQLIWKPMEKHLLGIHSVYYSPAGLLHRIAFEAVRSDSTSVLIDNYRLARLLSTRSLALPKDRMLNPTSGTIWGDIDYNVSSSFTATSRGSKPTALANDTINSAFNFYTSDTRAVRGGEWKSLPGTKSEVGSLSKLFSEAGIKSITDTGTLATEENFKALNGQSPQIIHIATHGFFLPVKETGWKANNDLNAAGSFFSMQQNPMFRSGLVLAGANYAWMGKPSLGKEDGILTAYEIAQIDLSGTDLVVLSACETALGDLQGTEGVIGLQRAFKIAGVKQMIMSLWRVPDKETAELIVLFYRNWLKGEPVREALYDAQLIMKEKYPAFYWAAFVVVE